MKKNSGSTQLFTKKPEHPISLKESLACSQELCVKGICYTNWEFETHIKTLKELFRKHR